nr:zinc-ribbon domain-containing protein [uncultured Celeribacter sp.]
MRLICPKCGAQYEVDARVIPDSGRDVQCSNCGETWFQEPQHSADVPSSAGLADDSYAQETVPKPPEAHDEPADSSTTEDVSADAPDDDSALEPAGQDEDDIPETAPVADPDIAPDTPSDATSDIDPETFGPDDFTADAAPEPEEETADDSEAEAAPTIIPTRPTALKESVRDILRAEAEFDQSLRQTETTGLETQPDLGLEEPSQHSQPAQNLRDRMARLRTMDPTRDEGGAVDPVEMTPPAGKRRDLLPDIEEINSTLSAASERDDDGSVPNADTRRVRARRSGFRTGFSIMVLIASLLVLVYLYAPLIAAKVPALDPAMGRFLTVANEARAWMNDTLAAASERMTAVLNKISG